MKTSYIFKAATSVMILIGAIGCAKKDSSNTAAPAAPGAPGPQSPGAPPAEPPRVISPLEGQWQSTCVKARVFGISEATSFLADQTRMQHVTITSREADCGLQDVSIVQTSEYRKVTAGSDNGGAEVLELAPPVVVVKAVSPAGLSTLLIRQWCGIKDWTLGVERDVTAEAKAGAKNCVQPLDKQQAWAMKDGRLYVGKADMGNVLTNQPQFFLKQDPAVQPASFLVQQ